MAVVLVNLYCMCGVLCSMVCDVWLLLILVFLVCLWSVVLPGQHSCLFDASHRRSTICCALRVLGFLSLFSSLTDHSSIHTLTLHRHPGAGAGPECGRARGHQPAQQQTLLGRAGGTVRFYVCMFSMSAMLPICLKVTSFGCSCTSYRRHGGCMTSDYTSYTPYAIV